MRQLRDFDPTKADLDPIETFGRDVLRLNLNEWIKFRHVIAVGNDASVLQPQGTGPVPETLKIEYQTIAKSHYQSVAQLVSAHQCLQVVRRGSPSDHAEWATYFRAQPEFYFHVGACLDGISRVALILLTQNQAGRQEKLNHAGYSRLMEFDKSAGKRLFKPEFVEIGKFAEKFSIEGNYLIRNGVTHGWQLPGQKRDGQTYWPEEIRTERFLAWPYIERETFEKYTWRRTIEEIIEDDYAKVEGFFNACYSYFISEVPNWERRNKVLIVDR